MAHSNCYEINPLKSKHAWENILKLRYSTGCNPNHALFQKLGFQIYESVILYQNGGQKLIKCSVYSSKLLSQVVEVKGYIGFSLIGRTVEWTKVKR